MSDGLLLGLERVELQRDVRCKKRKIITRITVRGLGRMCVIIICQFCL